MAEKEYIKLSHQEVVWIFSILIKYYWTDDGVREIMRLIDNKFPMIKGG